MKSQAGDDQHYPTRIVKSLDDLAKGIQSSTDESTQSVTSSLYGLVLGAAYALCESYHRLIPNPASFHPSGEYFAKVRLQLHKALPDVAMRADAGPFAAELIGLHINTAQHFIHFLLDRMLNVLIQRTFDRPEQEMGLVFYHFVGMRIALLRWRLAGNEPLGSKLADFDSAFTGWSRHYQAGTCNDFVKGLLRNPEVKPPPDSLSSLEAGVRFTLGNDAGHAFGSLAYIIDRTNEAKHLPQGAGRAQLAISLAEPLEIRRLYEVEWAITFVAFESMVAFLPSCLQYLHQTARIAKP